MKKIIFLLVALILGSQGMFAQGPIRPYKESGYSIAEVKAFAVENSALASSWRKEFLIIINNALTESGEDLVVGQYNIYWILDHTTYERGKIQNFHNSKRIGNNIRFFSEDSFDGMIAVFRYGKCEVVVFKTICLNLLKVSGGFVASTALIQTDPIISNAGQKKSVYLIDTVHKTVYVYDTLVYSTTVYDDQYYYGNGSSYAYYAYAEPVWYSIWFSWPTFRYNNYYSFREYNCCCNLYTDFNRYEINYNTYYYGKRTDLPSGRGYDPLPVNSGQGYDPNPPNGRILPPSSGGAGIDPPFRRGQDPDKVARNTTRSFAQPSTGKTARTASTVQRSSFSSSKATTQRSFTSQQGRFLNGGNVQRQLPQTNQTQQQRNFNNSGVGYNRSVSSAQRQVSSQQGFQRSSGGSRNSTATYSTPQRQSFSGGGAMRSSSAGGASRSTGGRTR